VAAVQLHEPLGEGQAQPRALGLALDVADLLELLEDRLLVLGRDATPVSVTENT
jgi:hypothetical protein